MSLEDSEEVRDFKYKSGQIWGRDLQGLCGSRRMVVLGLHAQGPTLESKDSSEELSVCPVVFQNQMISI